MSAELKKATSKQFLSSDDPRVDSVDVGNTGPNGADVMLGRLKALLQTANDLN